MDQRTRLIRFRFYDSMPEPIRKVLQEFVLNMNPEPVWHAWRNGWTVRDVEKKNQEWLDDSLHATSRVYGPTHPEARQ